MVSNILDSPWPIALALLVLGIAGFIISWLMKGRTAASTASSKSLSGPGKVLFFFLLVGGVLASGFSYYGPYPGKVTQGLLIPYRDRDPSKGVSSRNRTFRIIATSRL